MRICVPKSQPVRSAIAEVPEFELEYTFRCVDVVPVRRCFSPPSRGLKLAPEGGPGFFHKETLRLCRRAEVLRFGLQVWEVGLGTSLVLALYKFGVPTM